VLGKTENRDDDPFDDQRGFVTRHLRSLLRRPRTRGKVTERARDGHTPNMRWE